MKRSLFAGALLPGCAILVGAARAQDRVVFSIDFHGPTVAAFDSGANQRITEADLMLPFSTEPVFNAVGNPLILIDGAQLGLFQYPGCVGHPAGDPCGIEVDALSYGTDAFFETPAPGPSVGPLLGPAEPIRPRPWLSVDEYAVGRSPAPNPAPNVQSEAPSGDTSADVFVEHDPLGPPPLDVPAVAGTGNVGVLDGNGRPSGSGLYYRGLGLVEPNVPGGTPPDTGDNLDALTIAGIPLPGGKLYFSLDAAFPDPLAGVSNSGSAAAQGVAPGDILVKTLGAPTPPVVYAAATVLGLDRVTGAAGEDDLDALVVRENGAPGYQRSTVPYDWDPANPTPTDMVIFSVRRGSAVIGRPDSLFGRPISEGDLLIPPVAGGVSMFPAIFIAAENFGLATTRTDLVPHSDDVDALGLSFEPCFDCNDNGVEDAVDIANGTSADRNGNGIPDECERSFATYCFCPAPLSQCSNPDATAGCANSTGSGGFLDATTLSTTSTAADDLVLRSTGLPVFTIGIYFMGEATQQTPFGDGLLCVQPRTYRLGAVTTGGAGIAQRGPGLIAYTNNVLPPPGRIEEGDTWHFQFWFRNVVGPCGNGFNTTNGLTATFGP